jgi:hypothetical protein
LAFLVPNLPPATVHEPPNADWSFSFKWDLMIRVLIKLASVWLKRKFEIQNNHNISQLSTLLIHYKISTGKSMWLCTWYWIKLIIFFFKFT